MTTGYDLQPDGTANLGVHIEGDGPEAVIGTVTVLGAKQNTPEEIRRAAGLEPGQTVLPSQLDAATLALWRSGRFFPFQIDMRSRGPGAREVDFLIRVRELEMVPPLSSPTSPDQDAVLRFIDWLNRGMDGDDLLVEWENPDFGRFVLGWSPQDGLIADIVGMQEQAGVTLSLSPRMAYLAVADRGQTFPAQLPVANIAAYVHILVAEPSESQLNIEFGAGISSLDKGGRPTLDLLFTPAHVFLKEDEIRREGNTITLDLYGSDGSLKLDAATGRLKEIAGAKVHTEPGSVAARQRKLEPAAGAMGRTSAVQWWQAVSALLTAGEDLNEEAERELELYHRAAQLVDLVIDRETLDPLRDLIGELLGKGEGAGEKEDRFSIPPDPKAFQAGGMMAMLVGFGAVWVAEEFLPEDSWAATFARELVFMLGGRTQHSREVMGSLLEDPTIGPVSCVLCAQVLAKIDTTTAWRFLRKAREQSNAAAFRHDWRMILDSQTAFGQTIERIIDELAAIDLQDENKIAELLPADMADWLHGFLAHLRRRPADQPLSEWIAPRMDSLWDAHLGPMLTELIERNLNPPADPAKVAATVDGIHVARFLVRVIEGQHRNPLRGIPLPDRDEAKPWTTNSALACAIRLTLADNYMREMHGNPSPQQIGANLDKLFPGLKGKEDDAWIQKTGLDRSSLAEWAAAESLGQQFLGEKAAGIAGDVEEKALRDYYAAHAATLGRKVTIANVFVMPQSGAPVELARCCRLVTALGQTMRDGLPASSLQAAVQRDPGARCQVFIQRDIDVTALQPHLMKAVGEIKVGEVTEPMGLGRGIAIIHLGGSKVGAPPDFETVAASVRNLWLAEKAEVAAREWFEAREASASIRVLEMPEGEEPVAPPPSSAFDELLHARPQSAVALLGAFWEKVAARDPESAGEALDRLFEAGPRQIELSGNLIDPLARKKQRDLARRCLEKAAAIKRGAARKHIDRLIEHHAKHHGCQALEILKEIREGVFGDAAKQL